MSDATDALQTIWNDYVAEQQRVSDGFWSRQRSAAEEHQRQVTELWPRLCPPPVEAAEEPEGTTAKDRKKAKAKDPEAEAEARRAGIEEAREEMRRVCEAHAKAIQEAWEEALDASRAAYREYRGRLARAWSDVDLTAEESAGLGAVALSLTMASNEDGRMQMAEATFAAGAEAAGAAAAADA